MQFPPSFTARLSVAAPGPGQKKLEKMSLQIPGLESLYAGILITLLCCVSSLSCSSTMQGNRPWIHGVLPGVHSPRSQSQDLGTSRALSPWPAGPPHCPCRACPWRRLRGLFACAEPPPCKRTFTYESQSAGAHRHTLLFQPGPLLGVPGTGAGAEAPPGRRD